MSLGVRVTPWPDDKGVLKVCDDDLRLCLDRSSDSDSQLELTELIESITCKEDSDTPSPAAHSPAREVVADIVNRLLDRVEATDAGATQQSSSELTESEAREIDCGRSRDKVKSHHRNRKEDTPKKVRRKRDRDRSLHERKKSRRRSTSCSTTSSACSDVSRKHRHHKVKEEKVNNCDSGTSPRVNPIFLWVKQDDTRIVEVLCEDYDKRNRIRLTKTAHGWRSVPRTERLDSTLSRSSLDLSPTLEQSAPLVTPVVVKTEPDELVEAKEEVHNVRKSRKKKRCDKRKGKCFKNEVNYVNKYKNVDVVNNNNSSVSNNNQINSDNSMISESSVLEPRLRSFGYKKACHEQSKQILNTKKKDNKNLDIDVYTFVSTPKTESDNESLGPDSQDDGLSIETETKQMPKLKIKSEPEEAVEDCQERLQKDSITEHVKPETYVSECQMEMTDVVKKESFISKSEYKEPPENSPPADPTEVVSSTSNEESKSKTENKYFESNQETKNTDPKSNTDQLKGPEICTLKIPHTDNIEAKSEEIESKQLVKQETSSLREESESLDINKTPLEPVSLSKTCESVFNNEDSNCVNSSTKDIDNESDQECNKDIKEKSTVEENLIEEEQPPPEFILPEPHLQTPEPSPPPLPETSTNDPEISFQHISLQPDTSLDSDTIHLPDTTTKSDTSTFNCSDIPHSQRHSIKSVTDTSLENIITSQNLETETKVSENQQESQDEIKTAEMLREEEIERQITADLDEDHLLAIEEILQGEECVEDFDDDDLPDEYSVSPGSPVNLVIDLKAKDQIDSSGIPLSLRTDDFLDMYHSHIPMKEHSEIVSPLPLIKSSQENDSKPIPPAHQQSKTKFLESILSYPKKCHKTVHDVERLDSSIQQEPLYLGVSRKSASPTVSSSDGRKFSSPDPEPKPKRMKIEDITLKAILNKNKENSSKTKVNKSREPEEIQQKADSTTKSRLLELLTNENEHISKLDPLTQLKEVLSDPELNVPDPLLVPRARLAALVANPAKEIPRLLAMKSENLSYPKMLTDPDLLVVSLSHLQSLLQATGKEEEVLKYQQQAQLLQQQMKQDQSSLDAATATALNQMMWLPYLSQLEAAAMACGNTQDFMTMLNMVFPSGGYPQMNPYMMPSPTPGINPYDYKSQLEFQQAFALWNEAMMQAATNQFAAQSLGSSTAATTHSNNSSRNLSKLYQNYQDANLTPKAHSNTNTTKQHQDMKYTSARTSPMSHNYSQSKYKSSQYPYTSMFSIPTSTPTTLSSSKSSTSYRTTTSQSTLPTPSLTSTNQTQNPYQSNKQKGYNYNYNFNYPLKTPSVPYPSSTHKNDPPPTSAISTSELSPSAYQYLNKHHYQQHQRSSNSNPGNCKSLVNILSKPKQNEVKPSPTPANRMYPTSTTMFPRENPINPPAPASVKQEPPKLKVKQAQHLVDPNSKPRLFNFDEHGEVGSTTGSLTPQVDETHPNLWHPLFSSHQQKSYSSPWQWTTPVTVSGE